jgi:hypothetical protein
VFADDDVIQEFWFNSSRVKQPFRASPKETLKGNVSNAQQGGYLVYNYMADKLY